MFNLNGIDLCIIVIILALNTSALNTSKDTFNVGTVLFTNSDLNKKKWSESNIELLQARRYYQDIIPSPSMNAINEDYVNNLLKYFTNAFSTIKRETTDPRIVHVMEKALSDAIGGYLKVWVLPVTKFTYYGGTISLDNAVKVFKYYEKLKRNLNTDGSGWRKPNNIILNSIAVTVIPFAHRPRRRSMKNPCEYLAYYEKCDTGLKIPTPYINWNDSPYTMFLPLKSEPLVQLDSPSSSKALLKYYDIAEGCCKSKSPATCNEFDLRFQNWLSNNIVPHIGDDKLYIAFESLFSLLNKTNDLIEKASTLCEVDDENYAMDSAMLSNLPPWMTSNKFLILILILIIEITWFVPALLYILCSRRKSKMKQRTKFFLDAFKRRRHHTIERIDNSKEKNSFGYQKDPVNLNKMCQSRTLDNGLTFLHKPRPANMEADTQCPSYTSKRSIGQVTSVFSNINNNECQCESVTLIDEKVTLNASHTSHVQAAPWSKNIKSKSQTQSFMKIHETKITKLIKDKSGSNSKPDMKNNTSNKDIKIIDSQLNKKSHDLYNKDETNDLCSCIHCIEQDRINIETTKITRPKKTSDIKANNNKDTTRPKQIKNTTKLPKLQTNVYATKNIKLNKSKGLKLNTGEPLLEIRIDKPAAEIIVDVACRKNAKPSKIPRLATTANTKEQKSLNSPSANKRPCICVQHISNMGRKQTVDDIDVKKRFIKNTKMNVTF